MVRAQHREPRSPQIRDYATNYGNGKIPYYFDVAYDIAVATTRIAATAVPP